MVEKCRRIRVRGLTLLETSVALSILAVFVAVFVSLTVRLANAQKQQETRSTAVSVLERQVALLREQPAEDWTQSMTVSQEKNHIDYTVKIRMVADRSDLGAGFAVFEGSVAWRSITGLHTINREFWVHERID